MKKKEKIRNEDLKNEVLELVGELGRVPTLKEYDERYHHRGMINSRFKSWNNFLLNYVNIKPVQVRYSSEKCSVDGCENVAKTNFLCAKHYAQQLRHNKTFDRTRFEKQEVILKDNHVEIQVYDQDNKKKHTVLIDKEFLNKIEDFNIYTYRNYAIINLKDNKKERFVDFLYGKLSEEKIYSYKNQNPLDCRKENVIIIDRSEMNKRSRIQKRNKTGVKGVYKTKNGVYISTITEKGENHYLGTYYSLEDAKEARLKAEEHFWGKVYQDH